MAPKSTLPTPDIAAGRRATVIRHSANLARKPLLIVEAAVLLGQSRSSLYRAIEKGDLPLPVFKQAGRWRVPRRTVERVIDGELAEPWAAGPSH
jgi:predicted DNA-binding transcriptional regulator AlpA